MRGSLRKVLGLSLLGAMLAVPAMFAQYQGGGRQGSKGSHGGKKGGRKGGKAGSKAPTKGGRGGN